jgi:gluconolactonase
VFFPQPITPIVPVGEIKIHAEGLDHPEGLAFDRDGDLWAGGEAGQLYRIRDGGATVMGNLGGFCLGITISRQQEIVVCNSGLHCVQWVDRLGRVMRTIDRVDGRPLRTPNFSVFDDEGNLYFSDSGTWGEANGDVFRVRESGMIEHLAGPFSFANGLAMSADGGALFVAESQRDRVTRVEIRKDGSAGAHDVYASGLQRIPDGLALDAEGDLFVTCYATDCIYRVRPDGHAELFAYDPEGTILARPTNIAFGGEGRTTMFVANLGRWHIASIAAEHSGQPLAGDREVVR